MTHRLVVRLRGALLLGAGRSGVIHDVTLRRADRVPYVPASALKGAIREQLVRLTDEATAERLLGRRGYRQDVEQGSDEVEPGAKEPIGGGYTRVHLGDGELDAAAAALFREGLGYTVRAQVAIDRQGRRAADRRLFQREVLGSRGESLVFTAAVDAARLDADELHLFEAATRAVFALGSSRSRGLGWVEIALEPFHPAEAGAGPAVRVPEAEELEVVLEALEPLSLGALPFVGNFQQTLDYLAASTVRGALVTAAMRRRGVAGDQSDDPAFRALVLDPETCVRFGDAAPADSVAAHPRIAPLTVRVGKYGGEAAGVADTLVRSYVQSLLAEHGVFRAAPDRVAGKDGVAERSARAGRWLGAAKPDRRVMTRLALDAASARGRDGALFSVELLERGSRFVTIVSNAGPEARQLLADAAAGDLRAGHGRGQGYGRLRIVDDIRARDDLALRSRLETFDAFVRQQIEAAAAATGVALDAGAAGFVAALLVTELVPERDAAGTSAEDAFHAALGLAGSEILHAELRATHRGSFDTTAGYPRHYEPVVQAGSVLLLAVPRLDDETVTRLEALERRGAGRARDRGLGAIRFSDPIFCEGGPA